MRMPIITAIVLVGFILAGCSGLVPNVPVKPPAGYTAAQVAADETTCAKSRSGQEHKEDFYTACMVSKGYTTYFGVGGTPYGMKTGFSAMVRATDPRPADVVETDLRACEQAAKEKAQGIRGAADALMWVPGLGPAIGQAATGTSARDELFRYFNLCMTPRGYSVEPWVPEAGGQR